MLTLSPESVRVLMPYLGVDISLLSTLHLILAKRSAFVTTGELWHRKVPHFGLTSAPATFQYLMEKIFCGLHWETLLLYLDDVIIISNKFKLHRDQSCEVFDDCGKQTSS